MATPRLFHLRRHRDDTIVQDARVGNSASADWVRRLAAVLVAGRYPTSQPTASARELRLLDLRGEFDEDRPVTNQLGCGDTVNLLNEPGYFVAAGDWEEHADSDLQAPEADTMCASHAEREIAAGKATLSDEERFESVLQTMDSELEQPVLDKVLESKRASRDPNATRKERFQALRKEMGSED